MVYPGEISYSRVYLGALTDGVNSFEISSKQFLDAAYRFGIDNPYPIVQQRISLYGNNNELELLLEEITNSETALYQFNNMHLANTFGNATATIKS